MSNVIEFPTESIRNNAKATSLCNHYHGRRIVCAINLEYAGWTTCKVSVSENHLTHYPFYGG